MAATDEQLATALLGVDRGARPNPRLVAVAQHLVRFETWASLTASGALDDAGAADLGAKLLALLRRSQAEAPIADLSLRSGLCPADIPAVRFRTTRP